MRIWDLAVIGAGPAGVAAAVTGALAGAKVLLIARHSFRPFAEVMPALGFASLKRIGLWAPDLTQPDWKIQVIRSWWGSDKPGEQNFLFNPHGSAVIIDRNHFDAVLRDRAVAMGVTIENTKIHSILNYKTSWQINLSKSNPQYAKRLLIATGQASSGLLATSVFRVNRQIAAAVFWHTSNGEMPDAEMRISSDSNGWWYSFCPMLNYRMAVYLCEPDFAHENKRKDSQWLINKMPIVIAKPPQNGKLAYMAAQSSCSRNPTGPGWALAGDTRLKIDPLSGLGVVRALEDGQRVARFLLNDPDQAARKRFRIQHIEEFYSLYHKQTEYYRMEQRYKSNFWQSRQQSSLF
jgi:flavin-dependent dehydrogenase